MNDMVAQNPDNARLEPIVDRLRRREGTSLYLSVIGSIEAYVQLAQDDEMESAVALERIADVIAAMDLVVKECASS